VSLDNGCVCCSLRKDIVKALAEIERRSRHRNKRVDQVILETTGLADPAPVAFTFFANPWIVSRFRLDSIVCVARHCCACCAGADPRNPPPDLPI
jgi:G3E family GTPase